LRISVLSVFSVVRRGFTPHNPKEPLFGDMDTCSAGVTRIAQIFTDFFDFSVFIREISEIRVRV